MNDFSVLDFGVLSLYYSSAKDSSNSFYMFFTVELNDEIEYILLSTHLVNILSKKFHHQSAYLLSMCLKRKMP